MTILELLMLQVHLVHQTCQNIVEGNHHRQEVQQEDRRHRPKGQAEGQVLVVDRRQDKRVQTNYQEVQHVAHPEDT